MEPIWFVIGGVVLGWQLAFCLLFRRVWLRLIPAAAIALATAVFFGLALSAEGWDALGYAILLILGLIMLGLCLVGWLVFAVVCIVKKRRARRVTDLLEQ